MNGVSAWALVTGANRGLGFGYCLYLLETGYNVILTGRDAKGGAEAVANLQRRDANYLVYFWPLDVTSNQSIQNLGWFLSDRGIALDALINNAAVCPEPWTMDVTLDADQITDVFRTNFGAPLAIIHELDSCGRLKEGAHVVNVSSGDAELVFFHDTWACKLQNAVMISQVHELAQLAAKHLLEFGTEGLLVYGEQPVYRVSKALLNAGTKALDRSQRQAGPGTFRINAICPGDVATRMGSPGTNLSSAYEAAKSSLEVLGCRHSGKFYRRGEEIPW